MRLLSKGTSGIEHFAVNEHLVKNVVDVFKGAVVGGADGESRSKSDSAVPKEVAKVHHTNDVGGAGSQIKLEVLKSND